MQIQENYARIQENIEAACAAVHRSVEEITLVAVTKFVPVERIAPVLELGITHVGENRAQEFRDKLEFFANYGVKRHFIGQLQTNKVKYVIEQAHLIQSVDRPELAAEISRQAVRRGITQNILIEVNIGAEAQKAGADAARMQPFLEEVAALPGLRVQGLMCVPPAVGAEETRPYFARMRTLFEACKSIPGVEMQHLSMGMSSDYSIAILEGATMVRVGSALFGPRQYV